MAPDPPEAWQPPAGGPEPFWPALLCVLAAIGLQLTLPARLTVGPAHLLPVLEAVLLGGLAIATPMQLERNHPRRRAFALSLTGFVTAANTVSLGLLTHYLLHHGDPNARQLIVSGALIWLTNILLFGLWYWEVDRGGPGRRALGIDNTPDLLFPQMSDPRFSGPEWRPQFLDYLYVAFTNATAFSPTDALPLTIQMKLMMMGQSLVSLVTLGMVLARAVNIL